MKTTTLLVSAVALVMSVASCNLRKSANLAWARMPENDYTAVLIGEVKNFNAVNVGVAYAEISDFAHNNNVFVFGVKDNQFKGVVPLRRGEAYELDVLYDKGFYVACPFFADQDTIRFVFDERMSSRGCALMMEEGDNREYQLFQDALAERFGAAQDELYGRMRAVESKYTEEIQRLNDQLKDKNLGRAASDTIHLTISQMMRDRSGYTPEYKALLEIQDSLSHEISDYTMAYLQERKPSMVSLRILYEAIRSASYRGDRYADWVQLYARRYSNQFTDSKLHDAIRTVQEQANVHEGMPFSDFTLPDKDGKEQKLSELIEGKYAILQFWATWCGSCITKRHTIQQIYEKYKDKGLVVVEVAREFRTDQDWRAFIAKEDIDWVELLAMDKNHSVGAGYGMSQRTGGTFLIAPDGTVLKIDPTREEIEAALAEI